MRSSACLELKQVENRLELLRSLFCLTTLHPLFLKCGVKYCTIFCIITLKQNVVTVYNARADKIPFTFKWLNPEENCNMKILAFCFQNCDNLWHTIQSTVFILALQRKLMHNKRAIIKCQAKEVMMNADKKSLTVCPSISPDVVLYNSTTLSILIHVKCSGIHNIIDISRRLIYVYQNSSKLSV